MQIGEVQSLFLVVVAFTMLRVSASLRSATFTVHPNRSRTVLARHRAATATAKRP